MKQIVLTLLTVALALSASAQKTRVFGTVKDASSGEALIAANVLMAEGLGVVTDLDGRYSIEVANGDYTMTISYIGYETQTKAVSLKGGQLELHFPLKTFTLNEVRVVADMAIDRETPVAFTNVDPVKIRQELAGQDLPMILNSTPGVYATQQGGGAGDARVTIRGFNQRNIAVMIDGVPMNDMENGWVFWSNWFGLDGVTQRIQVQRGLGASKLAIPAVGGSMNILTQGISSKPFTDIQLTVGNNGLFRTNIGYNSGRLENGWGVTVALSYDRQDGWVDQTWANRFFYFVKLQKQLGNHLLSLSAMGAPQERGQRTQKEALFIYDREYAEAQGVDMSHPAVTNVENDRFGGFGPRYNAGWGNLRRNRNNPNAPLESLNTNQNFYHKPIINLKHFWSKDNVAVSNIVYGSLGRGGGTFLRGNSLPPDQYGQMSLGGLYETNISGSAFVPPYDLNAVNDSSQFKSQAFVQANMNNHHWYGLLSTVNIGLHEHWDLSVGIDARAFWLERYSTPHDMMGGDYAVINVGAEQASLFNPTDNVKRPGDVAGYRTNTEVYTIGAFGQLEYKQEKFSGFLSASAGHNSYNRFDQMRKRDLVLPDTTFRQVLGLNDTITRNGQQYTHESSEAEVASSGWSHYWGGTAKAGVNYNINRHMNVFFNGGVFFRPPTIQDVYSGSSFIKVQGVGSEFVWGLELGYSIKYPRWAANVNLYRTTWENRPVRSRPILIGGTPVQVAIPALGAVHQGIEVDAVYKTPWFFDVEGLISIGDWRWKGGDKAYYYADEQELPIDSIDFDATGVRVGDAAQLQVSGALKFKPFKDSYIKTQLTYFDWNYANFDATTLQGDNKGRQSWQMPAYFLLDIHAGYTIKLKKVDVSLRASVLNVLDTFFVTDADNNATGAQTFDATGATVFVGMGRRWTATVGFKF